MSQQITIEAVLVRLKDRGYNVKRSGDVYRAQCPGHGGTDLNLAVSQGKNGKVVLACHSRGCSYEKIIQALGFGEPMPPAKKSAYAKTLHASFEQAVRAAAFGTNQKRTPDTIHRYDNLDGSENLLVLRWNSDQGKVTRPVSKVDGGYICGTKTAEAYPIYRLPQTAEALKTRNRIYICEGEKATDAAVSVGLTATTSAFGSQSATKTDWAVLDKIATERNKKLEIIVLPDNDKSGLQYAESLVEIFAKFKSKPIVKVVSIAEFSHLAGIDQFPEGGDFHDLLELLDGKTETDILHMVETMVGETAPEVEIVDDEPDSVYPWRPFPVDLLPITAARFVHEVAAANCCDPAGPAIATLIALATAIGNSRRLRLKRGWVFPAILWGMLIARKGSIKSWALAPPIKPLDMKQDEYHEQHKREKAEYDRKKAEYNKLTPAQRRNAAPFDLKEPVLKRIVSREATEQKLVKNCAENSRGLCVFSDELTTLLKGMGQYCKDAKGGNAQSMFNSLFNGEGLESERIGESRHAPHAFVCILGGIQPGMAKKCFDQEAFESGFASRFIPVAPPLRVATWSDAVVDEETEQDYFRLIFGILGLEMEPIFGPAEVAVSEWSPEENAIVAVTGAPTEPTGLRPILIETSPEALNIYKEFYNRTAEEMLALEDDNIRGTFEKLRTYAARLALVVHVTRFMEQELFLHNNNLDAAPWDRSMPRIDELECDVESMRIAVALADWFKYETRRVYSTWGGLADETPTPKGDPLRQRIVEFMEQKHEPVSLRAIQRKLTIDKTQARSATEALVELGVIESLAPPKGGRSPLFRLNPHSEA